MPQRAAPLPEELLQSLCGFFEVNQDPNTSLALQVGYYGLLRTGELLSLQAKNISVSEAADFAVLDLGLTKTSQRAGAADSVTVRIAHTCQQLQKWKVSHKPEDFLVPASPYLFRKLFREGLLALGLEQGNFRPYSLRRGGATMYFRKNSSFDFVRQLGRWNSDRTARIYLNDGLARLAAMTFDALKPPIRAFFLAHQARLRRSRSAIFGGRG